MFNSFIGKRSIIQVIFIVACGVLVYANSLPNAFVWDDEFLIKDNAYIKNPAYAARFFTESIGQGAGRQGPCYRPLQMLSYMFDYTFWKLQPAGYHLTNITLHILVSLALYWFVTLLFARPALSFLTSLFFTVHPVHTEAVTYISGRADVLAALCILLSLIFYVKLASGRDGKSYYALLGCAAAALLSKEFSLILPVLVLLYSYVFRKKILTKEFISITALSLGFIVARSLIIPPSVSTLTSPSTLLQRIPGFFAAVAGYVRLLAVPFGLHMEYGNVLFRIIDPKVIIGGVIFVSSLLYAFLLIQRNKLVSFSILWFFLCLLPVANLYPINAYMAEHWLYLPSIGFFLIVSYWFELLWRRSRPVKLAALALIAGYLCVFSVITIRQNTYWHSPVYFYRRTLIYAPKSPRLYHNLGKELMAAGRLEEAKSAFDREIELSPENAAAYTMLGVVYQAAQEADKAVSLYQKAIGLDPSFAEAHYNLGNVYLALNETEKAADAYKRAIEINPGGMQAVSYYNNLACIYMSEGRLQEGIALYEKALALDRNNPVLKRNIQTVYETMKDKGL